MKFLPSKKILLTVAFIALPLTVFAQTNVQINEGTKQAITGIATVGSLITIFTSSVVKATGTLFMSLAVVAFIYGIVEYIWGMREAKPDKISNGQKFMAWSMVALFVMFSVYGIVKFGQDILFQGKDMRTIVIPEINLQSAGSPSGPSQSNSPLSPSRAGSPGAPGLGGTSAGAGSGQTTLIQEYNGWKYYSDGTVIGPDGTYYKDDKALTGPGGQGAPATNNPSTNGGFGYDNCSGRSSGSCETYGCVWNYSSDSCESP